MEQRSDEWFAERLGKITGTRAAALMGTPLAQKSLMAVLVSEIAMAQRQDVVTTNAMRRGVKMEAEARIYYEVRHNVEVVETAFVEHPVLPFCGCSPDGLVGETGGVEIKCLLPDNHIRVMLLDTIDKKHEWQIKWNLFCSQREYWDYFGYCADMPGELASYEKRFFAKDVNFGEIEKRLTQFQVELNGWLTKFGLEI
jgi:putative phage-type endonuclease